VTHVVVKTLEKTVVPSLESRETVFGILSESIEQINGHPGVEDAEVGKVLFEAFLIAEVTVKGRAPIGAHH